MYVERLTFDELPTATRAAIEARVGEDFPRVEVENGTSAALACWAWPTTGSEMVFLKGLPVRHERIGQLRAEVAVAPFLPQSAPKLLWCEEAGGWLVLCFQGLDASAWTYFGDDSEHLDAVAAVLRELSLRAAPEVVRRTAWDKWGEYCDPSDEPLLTGDRLAHSDPAAVNFMTERDGRVWLVDWAWAMRAPAWLDTALWGFRLVLDGRQTAEQAARWCAKVPAFTAASREAVAVLAEAEARWWEAWQQYGTEDLERTVTAARTWARYWASP
ncbi:phosphotransferase family protein [Streptomyces sp. A 4/2]|uniref:phosphotransferase family protein n=1 Tax=Streptomyces sp. A 4/2 TaxID=2934314 RepID=UPI0020257BB3|nr:aminoglycoside phosphotransferase [Streptomyces sp. A 4/2]